jgi:hypothetical protein
MPKWIKYFFPWLRSYILEYIAKNRSEQIKAIHHNEDSLAITLEHEEQSRPRGDGIPIDFSKVDYEPSNPEWD